MSAKQKRQLTVVENCHSTQEYFNEISTKVDLTRIIYKKIQTVISTPTLSLVVVEVSDSMRDQIYEGQNCLIRLYQKGQLLFQKPLRSAPACIDMLEISEGDNFTFYIAYMGLLTQSQFDILKIQFKKDSTSETLEYQKSLPVVCLKLGHVDGRKRDMCKLVILTQGKIYFQEISIQNQISLGELTTPPIDKAMDELIYQYLDYKIEWVESEEHGIIQKEEVLVESKNSISLLQMTQNSKFFQKVYSPFKVIRTKHTYLSPIAHKLGQFLIKPLKRKLKDEFGLDSEILAIKIIKTGTPRGSNTSVAGWTASLIKTREKYCLVIKNGYQVYYKVEIEKSTLNQYQDGQEVEEEYLYMVYTEILNNLVLFDKINQEIYIQTKEGVTYISLNNKKKEEEKQKEKEELIELKFDMQSAMSIIGSHYNKSLVQMKVKRREKRGILYKDFFSFGNHLYLLHGSLISVYNILTKTTKHFHYANNDQDEYKNSQLLDPACFWLSELKLKNNTIQRFLFVAMTNGEIIKISKLMEYQRPPNAVNPGIQSEEESENESKTESNLSGSVDQVDIQLEYPDEEDQPESKNDDQIEPLSLKFPGKILKIVKRKNSNNEFVYALLLNEKQEKMIAKVLLDEMKSYVIELNEGYTFDYLLLNENSEEDDYIYLIRQIDQIRVIDKLNLKLEEIVKATDFLGIFMQDSFIYFLNQFKILVYDLTQKELMFSQTNQAIHWLLDGSDQYYYWRRQSEVGKDNQFTSSILFDNIVKISSVKKKMKRDDLAIVNGIYPHLDKIIVDKSSQKIVVFEDFSKIVLLPFLHQPRIKIVPAQEFHEQNSFIATKLFEDQWLVTLDTKNELTMWNLQTGKYVKSRPLNVSEEGDYSDYQYTKTPHQGNFDFLKLNSSFRVKRFQIIKITTRKANKFTIENVSIKTIKKLVGPYNPYRANSGLYSGDPLGRFIISYVDSKKKLQLAYYEEDQDQMQQMEGFRYLKKLEVKSKLKLVQLSLNFGKAITSTGLNQYCILELEKTGNKTFQLPTNVCDATVEPPEFISDNEIVFLTEDQILIVAKFEKVEDKYSYSFNYISQCYFPGSQNKVQLNSILRTGNMIVGEDILVFEEQIDGKEKYEITAVNNYNDLIKKSYGHLSSAGHKNQMKFIQINYKNKIEIATNSYNGYMFFKQEMQDENDLNEDKECNEFLQKSELYTVQTYDFYELKLLEVIIYGNLKINTIRPQKLRSLCYTQLPNGKTFLHLLVHSPQELNYLYETVTKQEDEDEPPFYIPFLYNKNKQTPLNILLDSNKDQKIQRHKSLFEADIENIIQEKVEEVDKEKSMTILLNKIVASYSFGLFKVQFSQDTIKQVLDQIKITKYSEFLQKSIKSIEYFKKYEKTTLNLDDGAQAFHLDDLWSDESDEKIDKQRQRKQGEDIQMEAKVLNYPEIQDVSVQDEFFRQLSDTKKESTVFQNPVIREIIEKKWALVFYKVLFCLLIPYFVFVVIVMIYVVMRYFDLKKEDDQGALATFCRITIIVFASIFFAIELWQLFKQGIIKHIKDVWNYPDFFIPFLIYGAEFIRWYKDYEAEYQDLSSVWVRVMYSIICLLMWLRMLYYFRIFKGTGYYIRMIEEVFYGMRHFFLIFLINILAFGFANYAIVLYQKHEGKMIEPSFFDTIIMTYRNSISDIQVDDTIVDETIASICQWLYLVLCTLFVIIVQFNLLIAIVNQIYAEVEENKKSYKYYDLVDLIMENGFLTLSDYDYKKNSKGRHMILFEEVPQEQEQEEFQNKVMQNHGEFKKMLKELIEVVKQEKK